jgi:hypothetical protein
VTAPPTAPTPPPIKAPVAGRPPVIAETPAPAPAPISPPVTARVPGLLPHPANPKDAAIINANIAIRIQFSSRWETLPRSDMKRLTSREEADNLTASVQTIVNEILVNRSRAV